MARKDERIKVMTILYQVETYENAKIEYDLDSIIKENTNNKTEFAKNFVTGVLNNKEELDTLGNNYLENWTVQRLDRLGRIIYEMGLYELKNMDTPKNVTINESVELAKNYASPELSKMINASLDKYKKELES